ncbi:hypothetical protein HMPREF9318_01981 [Streptococcus urinalis FB127-CNA-2]|uniref:Mannosyl-glycoprotein endo-beta-N-acetylglucosaminidase n=1 Tax=Streptococcus urinalis 2285-97 TaxID=764291 RepID=G5KCX5_9STRE|nr:CHAP domain-containing protein [Streptococcus urinalis]EHJ57581.1 mannosyl-glycoprotein endo-beta-N-acetylglucosaminidase [Streptococcus urinalis 2285-97]EKS17104.1 hypothetical protein HMPREF9318_01981 [Streptococcus urinalis FB127-CNA-2]VEF32646.1 amidase [Streptococcus urinalis]
MKKQKIFTLMMLMAVLSPNANVLQAYAEETNANESHLTSEESVKSVPENNESSSEKTQTSQSLSTDLSQSSTVPTSQSLTKPSDSNGNAKTETTSQSQDVNANQTSKTSEMPDKLEETKNKKSTQVPKSDSVSQQVIPSKTVSPNLSQEKTNTVPVVKETNTQQLSSAIFDTINLPSVNVADAYVEHWSSGNAYTHHLMSKRYGITAQQLDGYLQSTGIHYDSNRINGQKLLEWQKISGLDVRAIIAIAIAESSLGTAGVATHKGANMFGYAAFDSNPNFARHFNDEKALVKLTQETILQNQNQSFAIQDQKAKKLSQGFLDVALDGGVYFTDTSDSGKKRARIMEEIDRWIDQHGGTPAIPESLKLKSSTSFDMVPVGFKTMKANVVINYTAATYAWGQCTWYVYNRANELGYHYDPYMGNGGSWQHKAGYTTSHKAEVGYAVSFSPGQAGADRTYGHVAIVEQVREDGSVLISESNCLGLGVISYRTFTAEQASQLTYVIGKK